MPMKTIQTDYLVIGAGLIGSAVTMGLAQLGVDRVTLVDLDLSGEWSSSELNAGGVRATWSQQVNLLTSKLSIEYFAKHAERVGYRDCGYLWLHRKEGWASALALREMHVANGWPVDVLDVEAIRTKVPFIDKTDDLVGALYGVKDGLVNPNALKEHFREEAVEAKAKLMDGVWVCGANAQTNGTTKIKAFQFSSKLSSDEKKMLLTTNPETLTSNDGEWIEFETKNIVNCAGAWAPHLAKILAYHCPSEPIRRQISLFHARDLDLTPFGMIIDPSGVYFHPEAIYGLAGFAAQESPGFNFAYEGERFFEEYIWPSLHERSTAFESLKHVSGWAGLYENSPDHHAIVGRVERNLASSATEKGARLFEAHSFSGHGAMQSYAVGIALAEKMVKGRYETLDLSILSGDRFLNGKAIAGETWVI
jgi:FAD-dependent oxidoreductase domain-containing protein 1